MRRVPSALLAIVTAACFAAACMQTQSTSLAPMAPGSAPPVEYNGAWVSTELPGGVPNPGSCGNFVWQVNVGSDGSLTGTFSGVCAPGINFSGSGTGHLAGNTMTVQISGTASTTGGGVTCAFGIAGSGTLENPDTLNLTYSGTICGAPVSGAEVLRRPAPAPPEPEPTPTPSEPQPSAPTYRTPDPGPGQGCYDAFGNYKSSYCLPVPDMWSVVQQVAAEHPQALYNSCQDYGGSWEFMDLVVDRLRQHDTRWGYNWKRGNVGDPSQDAIAWHHGPGPDEGSPDVHVIDIIAGHCGNNPSPNWADVTNFYGAGAAWTSRGRF